MSKVADDAPMFLATCPAMCSMNILVFDGRVRFPDIPTTSFFDIPGS